MTLLEMIKKYEGIKKKMHEVQAKADEDTVDAILEDLHSVEAHPSVTAVCDKILKMIDEAITDNAPDEALTWAHVLQTLPE